MKTLDDLIKEQAKYVVDEWHKVNGSKPYKYDEPKEEKIIEEIKVKIKSSVPERYLDSETGQEIHEKIVNSVENKKGCYFYGPAGTGKTYIMYGTFKRFLALGYHPLFWNVPDKLADWKREYETYRGGESEITRQIETKRVLFIDDFGAEKTTDWNNEIIYRLVNYRYEKMLITFFATNLSLQELAERNGDRIASRIAEMCEIINIDGKDRRLEKK